GAAVSWPAAWFTGAASVAPAEAEAEAEAEVAAAHRPAEPTDAFRDAPPGNAAGADRAVGPR
ncbi:hypothetical protein ABZY09_14605, partial [Streptomyces sp. NPDC002928]|uniref:hypothetical protein n=1 Tax=Streptomyces sp. NPDC002928 TaxID=3154440 RepID=UPI0033AD02EC